MEADTVEDMPTVSSQQLRPHADPGNLLIAPGKKARA